MWTCSTCDLSYADAVRLCAECGGSRKRPRVAPDGGGGGGGGGSAAFAADVEILSDCDAPTIEWGCPFCREELTCSVSSHAWDCSGRGGGGPAEAAAAAARAFEAAFSEASPFSAYRLPPWALPGRAASRSNLLYWKVVVLAAIPKSLAGDGDGGHDGPPAHVTVAFWTERGAGTPLTGARVAAMFDVVKTFQGQRVAVAALEAGRGTTAPRGALVRVREALVGAANAATPAGRRPLVFRSTDGGPEEIANCHVTRGLAPPRVLDAADAADREEAAWLRAGAGVAGAGGRVLGWVLPLALTIVARAAPIACNDALHQALLWAPDSNRAATAVGCADAEVGAHTALKGLEAESAGYVQHALRRLRETGRGPQCAPQCG